ncbi:MAG: double zinc ribbon domain-containing protein [Thermoproteota archaeon]
MSQGRTCPRCGAAVGEDDDFCSLCGLRLPKPGPEEVFEEAVESRQDLTGEYAPEKPPVKKPVKTPQRPVQRKPAPPKTVVLKKCPNCNTPVGEDLRFCPNCGFNLEVARMRLRMRQQGVKQTYSRREFFSFEGYQLEGVPMTSLMLIIWAVWNFGVAVVSSMGFIQPQLPPPLSIVPPAVFNTVIGVLSILSAIGLLMVIRPLFYIVLALVLLEIPVSIIQIIYAASPPSTSPSPTGTPVFENFAAGLVGLVIVIGLTIQLLRVHKYFTGVSV